MGVASAGGEVDELVNVHRAVATTTVPLHYIWIVPPSRTKWIEHYQSWKNESQHEIRHAHPYAPLQSERATRPTIIQDEFKYSKCWVTIQPLDENSIKPDTISEKQYEYEKNDRYKTDSCNCMRFFCIDGVLQATWLLHPFCFSRNKSKFSPQNARVVLER